MTVLSMADELAAHRFFRLIPSELRVRLAGCAKNVVFAAGDRICVEGTHASGFFALRSGRVNVGIYVPHQGLQVLETRHAGDVIGFSWLFPPYRWQIDAVAAEQVRAIEHELRKYDPAMLEKPRWLVLNKADLMFEDEAKAAAEVIVAELGWTGPWYLVSALGREGTWPIMLAVQAFFDRLREDELEARAQADA